MDELLRKMDEPPPEPEPEGPAMEVLRIRANRVKEREEARERFGTWVGLQKAKRARTCLHTRNPHSEKIGVEHGTD